MRASAKGVFSHALMQSKKTGSPDGTKQRNVPGLSVVKQSRVKHI